MTTQKNSVTRPYTLEKFMKTVTKLKISDDTLEDFIRTLDGLVTKITKLSAKLAKKEGMKTIMPGHLDKATEEILRRGPLTVDEILQKIEPLTIIQLSGLAKKIKKMAEDLLKPKRASRAKKQPGVKKK
ncbi:hypothetical protein ES702_04267 [subsurface metagenome]